MGSKQSGRGYNGRIIKEQEEDEASGSISMESESSSQDSIESCLSTFSSSDLTEDASSSSSSSASSSNGSLYDLSEIMAQLPIKRGLSKFYEGQSQSFTSLASVESIEDLVKKGCVNNHIKRRKLCRSHGGGLDHTQIRVYGPKATISKKSTRLNSSISKK